MSEPYKERDPYRNWSYDDYREARETSRHSDDYDERRSARESCGRYERDRESSDRAYDEWLSGRDFSDPDPDGRFH